MKTTILIMHYNRKQLLINTINSILLTTDANNLKDTEILIVDDASNSTNDICNISELYPNTPIRVIKILPTEKWWSCPCPAVNKGISEAIGDVILLQGAEIQHKSDVLGTLKTIKPNQYYVYGCLSLNSDNSFNSWYQHSVYNPRCYNFCVGIHKADVLDLGGFDERFGWGTSYGDDDFIRRVKIKGMDIIQIDEPYTEHQYHELMQFIPINGLKKMHDKELFNYICTNEKTYKNIHNSYFK